jgi:hypothetical protein
VYPDYTTSKIRLLVYSYNYGMRKFLYVIVFVAGMVSLAVEFAASRLLGNYLAPATWCGPASWD